MKIFITNRFRSGVTIGWTFYDPDIYNEYTEIVCHFFIIDLHIVW